MIKLLLLLTTLLTSCVASSSPMQIVLKESNTVTIKGNIDPAMIFKAQMKLIELDAARKVSSTIFITIDSPGGMLDPARNFINFAKSFKNLKLICIRCASAAASILLEIDAPRLGIADVEVLLHEPMYVVSGHVNKYKAKQLQQDLEKISNNMAEINSNIIGISKEEYLKRVKDEWLIVGNDTIKHNLIDEIVEVRCSKDFASKTETIQTRTMFGVFPKKIYSCPFINN